MRVIVTCQEKKKKTFNLTVRYFVAGHELKVNAQATWPPLTPTTQNANVYMYLCSKKVVGIYMNWQSGREGKWPGVLTRQWYIW